MIIVVWHGSASASHGVNKTSEVVNGMINPTRRQVYLRQATFEGVISLRRISVSALFNRIVAPGMKRMTTADTPYGKPAAAPYTITVYGLDGVLRTGRNVTATRRE